MSGPSRRTLEGTFDAGAPGTVRRPAIYALGLLGIALLAALAGAPGGDEPRRPDPAASLGGPAPSPARSGTAPARRLLLPVEGVAAEELVDSFRDPRGGRLHLAIDIAAPRGTPVVAVEEARVMRLSKGARSGKAIRLLASQEDIAYFYAHLDGYARRLREGQTVRRGQVIGYVGTSGNAPAGAPHLHFAVYRLQPGEPWWQGEPINPYGLWRP